MIYTGTFDLAGSTVSIQDKIWNSLHIRKGSWFQRPDFGSELHLLSREKQSPDVLKTAEGMVRAALKWLTDSDKLTDLTISTSFPSNGKLLIQIQGTSSGESVSMNYFVPVKGA